MIKRASKKIVPLILVSIFLTGCAPYFSENRFVRNSVRHTFSFGFAGHDDYFYCKKFNPNFIKKYSNNVNPTRNCIYYQYYTCHVQHYCNGDKQCELEAAQYWIPLWQGTENDLVRRISITKASCEAENNNCNNGLKNDVRCRNLSSEKYKKIVKEEGLRNPNNEVKK